MGCVQSAIPAHPPRDSKPSRKARHTGKIKIIESSSSNSSDTVKKRLPDREETSTDSASADTDHYIERAAISAGHDTELAQEIARRQNSAVRVKINKYNQMHVAAQIAPTLVEVKQERLSVKSEIYSRVQSFEQAERDSKESFGPSLEELKLRREMRKLQRTRTEALPTAVFSM